MKNLDAFNFGDQFFNDKPTEEDPRKTNMETKVESMVTVPIHQAPSSVHPLSTPVIDLTPPKPVPSTTQTPIFTATTATTTTTLLLPPLPQQQSSSDPDLASYVSALEQLRDLPHKIDETVREAVKEAVQIALQAPLKERFRDLEAPSSSSKQKFVSHSEQPVEDVPTPDAMNISNSEDIDTAHFSKIETRPDWLKLIPEEDRPSTLEPDWTGDISSFINWFYKRIGKKKLSKADLEGPAFKHDYDISVAYGISHWWFKCKEFYIIRHNAPSDRSTVKSYMRILSVVSLKTYERYRYTFLKEIVLRRDDYNKYKISEADFKNIHPNDFENLYLVYLQGQLNHLSGVDKVHLFNAVNLWIRNIVIRKRIEDLQLRIESYQTKLNLT
ncbi:hypothetical protein Tco_1143337 [Tanacetum coccineum]